VLAQEGRTHGILGGAEGPLHCRPIARRTFSSSPPRPRIRTMLYRSIALSLTAALVGTDALALSSVPVRGAVSSPRGAVSMVESWYDSGKRLDGDAPKQKKEDTLGAGGGHAVGKAGMKAPEITAEEMEIQKSVMTHQRGWRSVLRGPSSW